MDDEPIHIKAPAAAFGKRAVSYTALARNADIVVSEPSTLEACLHFVLKDVDPEDGTVDEFAEGENEEWDLEVWILPSLLLRARRSRNTTDI